MIKVTVAGNVGKVEQRRTNDGDTVLSFSVASNTKVKNEKVTTWVNCSIFGKRADALAQYITQGARITVCGSLSTREYLTKKGDPGYSLECRVDDVALMGAAAESGGREERRAAPTRAPAAPDYADDSEIPF